MIPITLVDLLYEKHTGGPKFSKLKKNSEMILK